MANSLELQVSLGLQEAQKQIQSLRETLLKSVQMDSTAFKTTNDFLEKLKNRADELKGKMESAFKTSSDSKKYLKDYENLLTNLKTATEKFSTFNLDDFILTDTEKKQIDELRDKIKQLQQDLTNLRKGTIGNFFDDSTVQNADKVKHAAEKLGLSIENLTFSGLSSTFEKEMSKVDKSIEKSEEKLQSLQGQLNALSTNKVSTIRDDIQKAFDAATTGKSFKTDTTDYQELLKNFYSGFENYSGPKTNNIKAGGNVQDFINSEVDAIIKGCEQMRQRIPEYQKLQQEILNAYKTAPSANASKEAIQDVLKQYNVEDLFKDIDINNYAKYFGAIKARFKTLFIDTGLMDESTINQLQTNMVAGIQHIFDNADLTTNINTSAFKSQVSNILKNSGLNLNSQEIGAITNAIVKGFDLSALLDNTDKVMEQYRDRVQSEADTTKQALNDLNEKKKELNEADSTVNSDEVNNKRAENYQKTQEAATGAAKALHDVAEAHQQEAAAAAGNTGSNEDAIRVHEQAVAAIRGHIDSLTNLERKQKSLSNIQMAVSRWMGFWQVLNLTKTAINDMKKHIQELDTVMTSIAVVTNMSQDDLWGQISRYSEIARQYGVAIKGVYEVSQIYYQQGLQSNDVMTLTTETLKMARIAGLDYATAADYMTTAIRGFKLEMQDAGHVTDVFSALAATTASSTEELAVAISKTAASAEAVGSSFEATTAMMATMIATTRESATNIGTALKSVISRYGEMTADPTALRDSEGEEMSLNRVDAALQTVGITIHDTAGQFRDFDDVLLELMEKWDSLDSLSQRYIATLMAGNRQQSRFLALVSNVDEYKKALETANDAAGTGDLQTLKTLDSIDAKIERMKVTIQEFYTSSGIQDLYKNILDTITNVVSAGNSLPKVFGKIPGLAIAVAGSLISIVKSAATIILNHISNGLSSVSDNFANMVSKMVIVAQDGGAQAGKQFSIQFNNATQTMGSTLKNTLTGSIRSVLSTIGSGLSLIGGGITLQGLSKYGSSISADEDRSAGTTTRNGALLSIAGKTISGIAMGGAGGAAVSGGILTVPAAIIGGITGLTSGLVENFATLTSAHEMLNVSISRQIELADKAASQAQEEVIRAKGEEKALSQAYNQLKELEAARYDSIEAEQAYKDQMNQLRDSYPSLVESIDQAGNAIITTKTLEEQLAAARQKTSTATIGSIEAELKKLETQKEAYNRLFDLGFSEDYNNSQNVIHRWLQDHYKGYESTGSHAGYDYNLLKWYGEQMGRDFTPVLNSGDSDLWKKAIFTNYIDIYQKLAQSMTSSLDEFGGYDNFIATNLSYYLNEIAKATDISLDELTEIENFDTNLLFDLKGEKLIELIKVIQKHASEHINSITKTYENIDNTLQYEKTKKDVNSYLDQLKNSPNIIEQQLYNQIKDYSSFISFVFDSKFGSYIDMNAEDNTKYRNEIATWVSQHQSLASSLMQADYNSYRSMIDFYADFEGVKGSVVDAGWKEQFEKLRKEATDGLSQQLNNIFDINSELFKDLFNDNTEDGELTTQNISYLRAGLTHYQDLIKDGQHAAASAYLNSLNQVFNQIGALDDSFKQTQIAPIISSLDFTSSESLTKAAEQLQSMGGFDDLVNELNNAAVRLMYNVGAMTQRLQASLQETIENIEKAAESAGKGVKYSEAYKNAADILTKYDGTEELAFDDIYQYNEAVGGYLLTRRGLELQLSQQSADVAKEIEDAKTQAGNMSSFLSSNLFKEQLQIDWTKPETLNQLTLGITGLMGVDSNQAQAYLTQMQEIYEGYDGSVDWDTYIQEQKDKYEKLMQVNEDMYQSLVKNSIGISIVSLDYTKIAGGESNYLKDTLAAYLVQLGLDIDNYWNDLLEGKVDSLNKALKDAGVDAQISEETSKAAIKAQVQSYLTAIEEIQSGKSWENWSNTTVSAINEIANRGLNIIGPENTVKSLYKALEDAIGTGNYTLEQYNSDIAALTTKIQGLGKEKATTDLLTGGFKLEEFATYLNTYFDKLNIKDYFDDQGNFIAKGYESLFTIDEHGQYQIAAGKSMADVLQFFNEVLFVGIKDTSKLWKDFLGDQLDQDIAQRAKDNQGKQIASQLQTLSSAKVGDEINVSSLTSEMQAAIGAVEGTITISSEYQRDNLLLLIKTYIDNYKGAGKEALQAVYRTINDSIISSRGTKGANLENIIQSSINLDDYRKALATEFGENGLLDKDIVSDEAIKQRAINRGYIYDEYSKQLIATREALSDIDAEIAKAEAPDSGATEQTIRTLKQKREALVTELNRNYENEALIGVLSSYENISEQALNDFRAEFGNNYDEYFDTDALGNTFIKDFEGLKAAMANYREIFDEYIATIADSYIDNISKAGSLATSGTTSQVEIQGFQQAFGQLFNGKQANFVYDSIINAWVLDINDMIRMIQESANKLEFVSETEKQTYIQNQIDALFKDNLDFSQFLSGAATTKESNTLKSNLQKYFITKAKDYGILGTKEGLNKWAQEQVDSALETLSKGGSDAIEELKRIKPEATAEELQAAYEAQIAPIKAAAELVDSLEVGSFVATENIEALTKAGFTIESNVVVKTAENLVGAYKSLYNQMAATGEATISSLNTLYATMLDAADQQNIDTIEVLQNATGLTYSSLGEILSRQNIKLEDVMANQQQYGIQTTNFGKIIVANWTAFAKEVFGADDIDAIRNNPEYLSAFKTYNDSLIELNKTIEDDIADEISQLSSAKRGDWLNLTNLYVAFERAIQKTIDETDFSEFNSNIPNLGRRAIVSSETMQKAFGDNFAWDDYGTIYGKTFTAKQLNAQVSSNVGMSFAQIDENGIPVKDIDAYANELIQKSINLFGKVTAATIKYIDSTERNLLIDINDFANDLEDAEVWNKQDTRSILAHEREAETSYGRSLYARLHLFGASFENGILKISEEANLLGVAETISEIAHSTGIDLGADLAEIEDTIHSILQSYTDAIVKGISGGLTNAEALDLQEKAFDMGLGELSFDETAEGLKLAQNSAIELYDRLKLIDGLQGRLVFDALNKSLQESNEHYQNISDIANRIAWIEDESHPERAEQYRQELELAKEIYAVRSTSEDSSFNFMSNAIPSGQNNPINYYKNWASAIRTFNDALKNKGSYTKDGKTYKSGFVDYDYWYNLVTEMNNIAALGGNIEFAGETLDGSLEAASKLIQKGAASLVATNTGDIKVALSGMSLDFEAGADNFSSGVTDGIQAMAKSQIEMLDGMIQLLETVVAMEKLGDITGENDTIDISDLFPSVNWEDGKDHIIENKQAIDWINNEVLTADADSELGKFIDNALLNNRTVRDTLKAAVTESEGINEETAAALSSLLNSLWQMYISNDYNLNDPYNSFQQIANASNLDMVIPMGDAKVIIERGAMIVEEKDKNGEAVWKDVQGNTYKDQDEAFAAAMMSAQGIDTKAKDYKYNAGTKTATGTLTIDNNTVTVTRLSDGSMSFVDTEGNTGTTLNEYIETIIAKQPEEVQAQKRIQLQLQTGAITLDSVSYRAINEKLRQELETAFSNGDTITINRIIEEHAEFKSLKGKTAEEQAKILGLELKTQIINIEANTINATGPIEELQEALDKLQDKTITITTVEKTISDAEKRRKDALERNYVYDGDFATGNLGLAKAKGTLMGELGPELVVSQGHYYVVGQNGPEMVDLAEDAIVFNHLQTKSLLEKGTSTGRGKAVTNERTAIAFASGSIHGGPAMASATALLATLKELRTQWQALAGLSAKDLAGAGGSGGGGGGGKDNSDDNKAFLKDLEKWYNWLQKIAQLESDITYQEQLRSKIQSDMVAHGQDYAQSQLVTLGKLEEQITTRQDLVNSQQEFFDKRRKELNDQSYPFSSLYEFDENGQLKYKDGQLAALSNLMGRNDGGTNTPGAANYTAKEQYQMIIGMNKDFAKYMDYNESGEYVWEETEEGSGEWTEDSYVAAVEAFWAKIEADQTEMQSIHDSIEEQKKAILADYEAQNEILHDIEDNEIAVQNKVYDALVDSRERAIEELEKTKDAIEESANKLIDGLQEQLDNERDMYEAQNNKDELTKLQRQLSILQRSGASTSEMASLQAQITQKQQDNYFEEQQRQIDAIQEASNNELEKLQQQIDLETEMLAYEKENGLLWSQVYDIMHGNSADGIAEYIVKNNSEYWGKSPEELIKARRDDLFEAQKFVDYSSRFDSLDKLVEYFTKTDVGTEGNSESADKTTNDINGGGSSSNSNGSKTGGTASGTVSNTGGTWKSDDTGWWYQYTGGSWATGWKNIDGKDYYFNDKGYMQTGWIQGSDGKWYYLGADGAMVTGTQSINGKTWNFDENGVWDGKDGVAEVTENAVQENTEETTTKTNTEKQKGWHVDGLTGVYGSKQLAINARQAKAEEYNGNSTLYDFWSNKKIKYYSEGGLDDYTGPVILHGTKAKPEAVLNASQTHILRDEILSNKPNSLLSLLSAWRDSVIGLADTSNINTNYDNGITIEKAEVIMQVHQIANDYDAQRAGEQALDKIMDIARKTIAQNRIGR